MRLTTTMIRSPRTARPVETATVHDGAGDGIND